VSPSAARSKIRARVSFRAEWLPRRNICSNSWGSRTVKATWYFFAAMRSSPSLVPLPSAGATKFNHQLYCGQLLEAIVTVTLEGTSARLVAKYRPVQTILAAMPRVDTYRRLALIRGVTPLLLSPDITTREGITEETKEFMRISGNKSGTVIVFSSISAGQNMLFTD
jgi:hypothetical protein